jgi:hypothetical protein
MANETNTSKSVPSTKSVESAENFLVELKKRAEDAHKNNDVFTLNLMQELIKVTSPIVTRALARFHREERARISKMASELRAQNREQKPSQSGPHATTRLGD